MREFVSANVYRRFLTLIAASGLKLPDSVTIKLPSLDKPVELMVLHVMQLEGYSPTQPPQGMIEPTVKISSWAVAPTDMDGIEGELVDAEAAWHQIGDFWFGKLEKVYKDTFPVSDKKLSGFGWCGNAERELAMGTFRLAGPYPLFQMSTAISILESLQLPSAQATKVGSVDETGILRPAAVETAVVAPPPAAAPIPAASKVLSIGEVAPGVRDRANSVDQNQIAALPEVSNKQKPNRWLSTYMNGLLNDYRNPKPNS